MSNETQTSAPEGADPRVSPRRNTLLDAIDVRTSVRQYSDKALDDDLIGQLKSTINAINTISGLSIQLVTDDAAPFAEQNASGHFSNARNFIAVVGPKDDAEARERAGFYLERLLLTVTLKGLSSVWVAGSWDKAAAEKAVRIKSSQELIVGAVIGYSADGIEKEPLSKRREAAAQRRAFLSYDDVAEPAEAPEWFRNGVAAALKAPTAMNRQNIRFTYEALSDRTTAFIDGTRPNAAGLADKEPTGTDWLNLGIVKLHFQLGAGGGSWTWGNPGRYSRDEVMQP